MIPVSRTLAPLTRLTSYLTHVLHRLNQQMTGDEEQAYKVSAIRCAASLTLRDEERRTKVVADLLAANVPSLPKDEYIARIALTLTAETVDEAVARPADTLARLETAVAEKLDQIPQIADKVRKIERMLTGGTDVQ